MTRMSLLSSPLLLGFEDMERLIDRVGKGGSDGYPPYNIERIAGAGTQRRLRRGGSCCASRWRWPASSATRSRSRSKTTS